MAIHLVKPGFTPANAGFLSHLMSISKSIRQLVGIKLAECGVLVGQDHFLLNFEDGERVTVAALAEKLSVRASTVSKMTDILQRKGWVGRATDEEDARKVLIYLTEDGRRVRDIVRAIENSLEDELASALIGEEDMVPALMKLDALLTQRLRRLR